MFTMNTSKIVILSLLAGPAVCSVAHTRSSGDARAITHNLESVEFKWTGRIFKEDKEPTSLYGDIKVCCNTFQLGSDIKWGS
jgi:hypothetical protein